MLQIPVWEMVGRLLLAAVLGFLVGIERELSGHSAGQRTHALAALGSATFALLSLHAFPGSDPARVAAGVVSGLGFLGAGVILRESGHEVHGLTTAAGIWAVGGVGLAIGAGSYAVGVASAALIGAILGAQRLLHQRDQRRRRCQSEEEVTPADVTGD